MRYLLTVSLAVLPVVALAADVSVSGRVGIREGNTAISVGFSSQDRALMDGYFREEANRKRTMRRDDDRNERDRERRKHDRDDDERKSAHKRDRDQDRKHDRKGDRDGDGRMPPGLAKRGGDLPPGLAKKDRLPPGLAKRDRLPEDVRYEPLPVELERKLPPLPDNNYVRVRVGQDIVLFDKKTRVVFDIAHGLGR